jgi:hypothetical protein
MRRIALAAGLALVLVSGGVRPALVRAAGPYDDLLKRTTANTNTLVLIDVKGAFTSPLAKAEKWAEKGKTDNRGGLGFVPPDAELVVIAGEVNLSTLVRDFQVGLVKVRNTPTMRELAAREGGTADEIVGRLAVLSPRDVYFTTFSGQELAAIYPADRQYTARYIKSAMAAKAPPLSGYLKKAVEKADGNTITIAVDLDEVVDKTLVRLTLPTSPSVAKVKTVDVNLLAGQLASVKGMTVAVKVTDAIDASVTVEFGLDPSVFRKTLPDLFRELIESQGIAINGFDSWQAAFTETTMTLSGKLTTADLKRIISLFAFPQPAGETELVTKGNEPNAGMTKRYLAAADTILADVKAMKDNPNYDKTATWHDKAAEQIEHLSRRNVDPEAVDAAFQEAKRLRAIAQSLRGVPIDANALASQQYYYQTGGRSVGVGFGWWGFRPYLMDNPTYVTTNIPEIQSKIAKVVADDQKKRLETWSLIERTMIDTRNKMSAKYKTPF